MWEQYYLAASVSDALTLLSKFPDRARLIAGATDLVLEIERGVRTGIETLIDISRVPGLDGITEDQNGVIHLGPLVTHNDVLASRLLRKKALPLVQACWQVGSPQIRNRGTIAGNLVTASPANDTISPLMALGASLMLKSTRGERRVPLQDFYTGVRKTILAPDEMVVDISFPGMKPEQRGCFVKVALRNAQAISVINVSVILGLKDDQVTSAAITLGAVAPVIIHASEAETFLVGRRLSAEVIRIAAELTKKAARPISDIRSSDIYRAEMVEVAARRGLQSLVEGTEIVSVPENPVLLATSFKPKEIKGGFYQDQPIHATVNGQECTFTTGQHKTLANLLRDEGGLTGTKIACGEGECGACTVWMDGKAVMSCLVPAPRANGARIETVEGVGQEDSLHPVQAAFLEYGAVQCGFCTPGFVMSAAKLLDERPNPTHEDILYAISGNLCRCTGYFKIIEAIEHAAQALKSEMPS